jgi:hypothetical protein
MSITLGNMSPAAISCPRYFPPLQAGQGENTHGIDEQYVNI